MSIAHWIIAVLGYGTTFMLFCATVRVITQHKGDGDDVWSVLRGIILTAIFAAATRIILVTLP